MMLLIRKFPFYKSLAQLGATAKFSSDTKFLVFDRSAMYLAHILVLFSIQQ